MSEFEHGLKQARRRQRFVYALVAVVVALAAVGVTAMMAFTNATALKVLPKEAAVSVEITAIGSGAVIGGALYTLSEAPKIVLRAPGYRTTRVVVPASARGKVFEITLRESPGLLRLSTAPEVRHTRWRIDGVPVVTAATLEHEVAPGTHTIDVDSPYHLPQSHSVGISRGEEHAGIYTLEPVSGRLEIAAIPADAKIRIDDEEPVSLPLAIDKPGGSYAVTLSHPDYHPLHDTVAVTHADSTARRTYRLERLTARVSFDLAPNGGLLLVDGIKVDPSTPLELESKVPISIRYSQPGYTAETARLTLQPGEERTVALSLKRELGSLEIRSQPSAMVHIDGKAVGRTPLSLRLPALAHRVELRAPGYRTIKRAITPSAAAAVVIDETLQSELAARLASAPREYVNDVGIALKMFEPGSFTMGAPRHEPGQRANEFIRSVRLDKVFYAAKHEVTQAQFAAFKGGADRGKLPVSGVTWLEAAAFCNWLSAKEGLTPVYGISGDTLQSVETKADGYRLLSEAEWEWLARRAGRSRETVFPWGDKTVVPAKAGNIADESARGAVSTYVPRYTDGFVDAAPVGSFPAEPSGLFDLTGNVAEWTHDFYSLTPPPSGVVEIDPLGPEYGDAHTIKGSSWRSASRSELRAAYRDGMMSARDDVGFRVGRYLYGGDIPQ